MGVIPFCSFGQFDWFHEKTRTPKMLLCLLVFLSIGVLWVVGCLRALARKDSMFFLPGIICRRFTVGGPLTFLWSQLYRWNLYQFTGTCITFFNASLENAASARRLGIERTPNPWPLSLGMGNNPMYMYIYIHGKRVFFLVSLRRSEEKILSRPLERWLPWHLMWRAISKRKIRVPEPM